MSEACQIIEGDCIEVMRTLPPKSVQLTFGSPPYEVARSYGIGFALKGQAWVDWMMNVIQEALRVTDGLVAMVLEGQTRKFRWTATPALLMADLHRAGITLRKPPIYQRVGIPGSGGPDWLRNDYEFIVCATNGGKLPWSDNTAMGAACKFPPGGVPSHHSKDGRVYNPRLQREGDTRRVRTYSPPDIANPGNVIDCGAVGGGSLGDKRAHENEAPFPEKLAEFFIRSFCPPGGTVLDCFSGSGTTAKVALACGRKAIGIDVRASQVELSRRRTAQVQKQLA